jgi:hypothetical protein
VRATLDMGTNSECCAGLPATVAFGVSDFN